MLKDLPGLPGSPGGSFAWAGLSPRWERALFFLLAALAVSGFFVPEINPDLFWHLSAGRYMVEHKAIPRADFLSHTMAGTPWYDFEWLTQLIYYPVYRLGGYPGFILLRALLLSALLAAALALLRLFGLRDWVRGGAALFIMKGQNLSLRPDLFSLIFFGGLFWVLESVRLGRLKLGPGHFAAGAALFCLWANLHLGFAFGLLLMGFYAAGELIERGLPWVYGQGWEPGESLRGYLVLIAACVAGTVVNPYGPQIYGVLLEHSRLLPALQELILEWQPADITDLGTWPYWLLVAASLAAALAHFILTRRTAYAHLLCLAYFLLSSSIHVRHRTFFFLFGVPLTLWWLKELDLGKAWVWAGRAAGAAVAAAAAFSIVRWYWPAVPLWSGTKWCSEPAFLMCRYLGAEERLKGKKLLNTWHHGGYLGFKLYPDYRVFFDGRYIFHDLLLENRAAVRRPESWQRMLDKYGVDVACLQRSPGYFTLEMMAGEDGRKFVGGKPFYQAYMPPEKWALVYWDDANVVMARRSSVDPVWLAGAEYRFLLPDVLNVDTRKQSLPALRRELARHLRQTRGKSLEDRALRLWLGGLLARKG